MMRCVRLEVAQKEYYLPLVDVREVATAESVTAVPTAPGEVVGLTWIRGQVLPVVDPTKNPTHRLRPGVPLVVVDAEGAQAALLVDRVLALDDAPKDGVERLDLAALFAAIRQAAK
jgi:chemotaxis signal transduction protein